jgi:hypothetical protein
MSIHLENTEWDIIPQVGSYIELDSGAQYWLEEDDTNWDLCQFRVEAGGGLYHLAVNVEVTGWSLQHRSYSDSDWIRVAVTFVADPWDVDIYTGERMSEDETVGGWMVVTDREKVWSEEKFHALLAEAKVQAARKAASRAAALEL